MSARRLFDMGAAIRAEEGDRARRFAEQQARAAAPKPPPRPRTPVTLGTDPEALAEEVLEFARKRTPAIAILIGYRELKAFRKLPGAREHFQIWPGGEETFARVPIVVRKGAGAPRVFADLADLDGACHELPQPYLPAARWR